jgi:beta-glucosidase
VPEWDYALKGLDQESGIQMDVKQWGAEAFTDKLRDAYAKGKLSKERLSDMVRRILRSVFAVGADKWGPAPEVDMAKHNEIALEGARQGIVLLKNDRALPLPTDKLLKIAVIGGHAHKGIISGTGSGAVNPIGGYVGRFNIGGPGTMGAARDLFLFAPSPLAELKKALLKAQIEFDPGYTPAEAVLMAKRSDVVIAFGIRVEGEGFDNADLSLPWGQDDVIDAVATANKNTIVVLETGNPVSMPWRKKVKAIVQAWYPGQAGARAIADILSGKVNPSGRLPITFPADLDQTPRPKLSGLGTPWKTPVTIKYNEGAEVGYRWFAKKSIKPMFPFGLGLSYTTFDYSDLKVEGNETITATFTLKNTGKREGADVPQLYLTDAAGDKRMRLLGFERVVLKPGESREVTLTADPRLLARFHGKAGKWRIAGGTHKVAVGKSATDLVLKGNARLSARQFGS